MEKRTLNDADDAGPLGQHHQHHWGFLGCPCPLRKHETGLACIAQAKPYKMCCWARVGYWQLICKKMQSWART